MHEGSLDLSHLAPGTSLKITAKAKGILNRLDINADIRSAIGQVGGDIRLEDILNTGKQIGISGNISTKDLNVGKIIGQKLFGEATMRATVQARLANGDQALSAAID
jgi:hypothetical protein